MDERCLIFIEKRMVKKMENKNTIRRSMISLLLFISLILLIPVQAEAITVTCENCTDCSQKIANASIGDVVRLTADITDHDGNCIVFNGTDGVTFDGDGHVIDGDGDLTGYGIYLSDSSNNNTLTNCEITGFHSGIYLFSADNCLISDNNASGNFRGIYMYSSINITISDNTVDSNDVYGIHTKSSTNNTIKNNTANSNLYGIYLTFSSDYNIIEHNTANNNDYSISLSSSNENTIYNNLANYNKYYGIILQSGNYNAIEHNIANHNNYGGIYLSSTTGNMLSDNIMSNDTYNFVISGYSISNYIQNIDSGNTVDGRPMHYLVDQQDQQVPTGAGFVGLVNCRNMTVIDQTLTKNSPGVLLVNSSNSVIENVNASGNDEYGIHMRYSNNNALAGNTVNNNDYGIYMHYSDDNVLTGNTANSDNYDGIHLYHSTNNTLSGNTVNLNSYGIHMRYLNNNTLAGNTVNKNNNYGVYLRSAESNLIYNNFFNNTDNFGFAGTIYENNWNTTNTSGTNILGDPHLGGNYWANPTGTGYSDTCADSDHDGFCDLPNVLAVDNVDYLPLSLGYVSPLAVYNISLFVGWNLISTPLEPVNTSIEVVLGGLTTPIRVFAYDASLPEFDRWTYYDSALPPVVNTLAEINAGRAYWLLSSVNETLTVTGMSPEPKDIDIYSGWNFVGYNWDAMNTSTAVSQLTTPTRIFAYDASLPEFDRWTYYDSALPPVVNTLHLMSAGWGYWLHSEDNETWAIAS